MYCLIIDDNEIDIKKICRYAKCSQSDSAQTIAESLQYLDKAEKYDVVFIDHKLPDGNSFTLIEQIRKRNKIVPIIVVTRWANYKLAVETLKAGASGFLSKEGLNETMVQEAISDAIGEAEKIETVLIQLDQIERKLDGHK